MGDMADWQLENTDYIDDDVCPICLSEDYEDCYCEDEYDGEPDQLDLYCAAAEVDDCGDR